jgi:transcriptional regulator with XRE-family HTH domain
MDAIENIISQKIKQLRLEEDLTRKELAKLIGYSEQAIYYYERGERSIPAAALGYIAKKTNRDISWFFTEDDLEISKEKTELYDKRIKKKAEYFQSTGDDLSVKMDKMIELLQLQIQGTDEVIDIMKQSSMFTESLIRIQTGSSVSATDDRA